MNNKLLLALFADIVRSHLHFAATTEEIEKAFTIVLPHYKEDHETDFILLVGNILIDLRRA
jgi:hypothetical protein